MISIRLCPVDTLDALADAGLVIEAIVENLQVKQALFNQLEACAQQIALLPATLHRCPSPALLPALNARSRWWGCTSSTPHR